MSDRKLDDMQDIAERVAAAARDIPGVDGVLVLLIPKADDGLIGCAMHMPPDVSLDALIGTTVQVLGAVRFEAGLTIGGGVGADTASTEMNDKKKDSPQDN